ncbi:flagellar motor switch protein FliG [Listeria monocytogenes]|nr:flagellar motor switch protein FliG [Listeria monocytogenes]
MDASGSKSTTSVAICSSRLQIISAAFSRLEIPESAEVVVFSSVSSTSTVSSSAFVSSKVSLSVSAIVIPAFH